MTVSNVAPNKYVVMTSETSTPITTSVSIGEIVRSHDAAFLVDAAQTAGSVPIDVEAMGIDVGLGEICRISSLGDGRSVLAEVC